MTEQPKNCSSERGPRNCGEEPRSCNSATSYRCSSCGFTQESSCGAPKSCTKCDNGKFYKVK